MTNISLEVCLRNPYPIITPGKRDHDIAEFLGFYIIVLGLHAFTLAGKNDHSRLAAICFLCLWFFRRHFSTVTIRQSSISAV